MNRFMVLAAVVIGLAMVKEGGAQVGPAGPGMEAPTKLETIELRKGTVVVKGYNEIRRVDGEEGSSIVVSAIEMKDVSRGNREMGLAITAAQGVGDQHRSAVSYVDYDEIDGLMGGIDFMGKGEGNASALPNYEAQFRTRSNLEVVSF